MQVLFIINTEIERRSLNPVFDVFIKNNVDCKLLKTDFIDRFMRVNENYFIDANSAQEMNWDFVISSNPIQKNKFNGRRVVIHHGSMFGNNAWSLKSAYHSDIYFGLSSYELQYIKHHLKDNFDKDKFIASGNPANDHLLQYSDADAEVRVGIRKELGLKQARTILLTSHWTSLGNFRKFGTGLIDALIWNFPNDQIICTCHPLLLTNPKKEFLVDKSILTPHFDSQWLISTFKHKAAENNNIKIIFDEVNLAELLAASDIFIGDNSSLLAEAALFNIPLFANIGGAYFDATISKIVSADVYNFGTIEELIGGIKNIDSIERGNLKIGGNIKKLFMNNVGFASKIIFETLTSVRFKQPVS